jgi:hypothetical protein
VTKDEFVGKAADELRKLYAPGVDKQHLRNLAAAALEAVGAWQTREALHALGCGIAAYPLAPGILPLLRAADAAEEIAERR